MITKGIHRNLGMASYHSWKLDKANLKAGPISCSMLRQFTPSPFAWRWAKEKATSSAMRTGSLFDLALTDPGALENSTIISPYSDYRKKEAQEWRNEKESMGQLIVTEDQLEHAKEAAKKVLEHEVAGSIMDGCSTQVGVIGEIADIPAKCLIDIEPCRGRWEEHLFDYKTISTGLDDDSIRKAIGNFKYHWQAAFYRTLKNKVDTERHCETFGFVFQDIETLEVRVVELSGDDLSLGNKAISHALKTYVKCAHNGITSQYAKTSEEVSLMPYHAMNEDEWLSKQEEIN